MKYRDKFVSIHIGNQLFKLRKKHKLSMSKIGKIINTTPQQVQKYEIGENLVPIGRLITICVYFQIDINYFVNGINGYQSLENTQKHYNINV